MNFNPRSPHGERLLAAYGFRMAGVFQSTLPARGATDADVLFLCNVEFQSTLPARGATRVTKAECLDLPISIHAPRTGSDGIGDIIHARRKISIHAPRTGSDLCALAVIVRLVISIHAPRTGSDRTRCSSPTTRRYFNPRSPHGERLGVTTTQEMLESISIHAPRTGSDRRSRRTRSSASDFNPRSPHGERRGVNQGIDDILRFQSTLPARGATFDAFQRRVSVSISIHAPRTGSDGSFQTEGEVYPHFNPRSPHGERPSRALTTLPPC